MAVTTRGLGFAKNASCLPFFYYSLVIVMSLFPAGGGGAVRQGFGGFRHRHHDGPHPRKAGKCSCSREDALHAKHLHLGIRMMMNRLQRNHCMYVHAYTTFMSFIVFYMESRQSSAPRVDALLGCASNRPL